MNLLKIHNAVFFLFILLLASCTDIGRKRSLDAREKKLNEKEQQIAAREQRLTLKEKELSARQTQIDSLNARPDTTGIYNPQLIGNWKVTMQCTETTCEGSAVGDTKTETWKMSYQNNKVIARVIVNDKVMRTYSGLFRENSLELSAKQPAETDTHMDVTLTPHLSTQGLLEGQRIINQAGKCKIVYNVKAEKI